MQCYINYHKQPAFVASPIDNAVVEAFCDNPFENAENLWNSFKTGIYNHTNQNGGVANTPLETDNSIEQVDLTKVDEVLLGNRPLSDLGCE